MPATSKKPSSPRKTKPRPAAGKRAPTPKARWGDREARRADIVGAARHLLERHGFAAFTMRDVAHGAGVTPGLLYSYFSSKEELFALLYAERLDRLNDEIAPACAHAESPEALFVAIANRYLAVYEVFGRELNVWAILLESSQTDGAAAEAMARPLMQAAARNLATVQSALVRLGHRGTRDRLAVPLLWATLQGLCDHFTGARHRMHPYAWDELIRFAARTLVRGLTAGALAPIETDGEED